MKLNFSLVADTADELLSIEELTQELEIDQALTIEFIQMCWKEAWSQLFASVVAYHGPEVSALGTTWSDSLASMGVLRPFANSELFQIGGPAAFIPASWVSVVMPDTDNVYAIPWTSYTNVIYYRRDLLNQAGIDEQAAFATPQAFIATLEKLRQAGTPYPMSLPTDFPYADLVHLCSPWVWGAGGGFVDEHENVLLSHTETHKGLAQFFELFHYIPADCKLSRVDALQRVASGQAAITIAGAASVEELCSQPGASKHLVENLGVASTPGIPWVGGNNLVIWEHSRASLRLEQGAVRLVAFLASPTIQKQLFAKTNNLPARQDVLADLDYHLPSMKQVVKHMAQHGRAHPPTRLWARIETLLAEHLSRVAEATLNNPDIDIEHVLVQQLEPLVWRLKLLLKQ